jgi:hypothetical protein
VTHVVHSGDGCTLTRLGGRVNEFGLSRSDVTARSVALFGKVLFLVCGHEIGRCGARVAASCAITHQCGRLRLEADGCRVTKTDCHVVRRPYHLAQSPPVSFLAIN